MRDHALGIRPRSFDISEFDAKDRKTVSSDPQSFKLASLYAAGGYLYLPLLAMKNLHTDFLEKKS